ncbi:MAG: hypothetical protein KIT56_05865 [Gammaproteobacteria bacterium]|nr:hypothetical protein [Gammaproteobacteria bacterium]MCW5583395.1 hypothetical protein [Gammaproteobacteria bacterium]
MDPKDQQEIHRIYTALLGVGEEISKVMDNISENAKKILALLEDQLKERYSQNATLKKMQAAQPLATPITPTNISNATFSEIATRLDEQNKKLGEINHRIQKNINAQLALLAPQTELSQDVARKIIQEQDAMIKTALETNKVAQEAQALFQQQAYLSSNLQSVTPEQKQKLNEQKQKLNEKIEEATTLNHQLKEQVKKQHRITDINKPSELKNDTEAAPKPRLGRNGG